MNASIVRCAGLITDRPPSSSEVKNAWSYASIPPYAFMAWCLLKHRDNFTFTFTYADDFHGREPWASHYSTDD
jgi:hypothetical protein